MNTLAEHHTLKHPEFEPRWAYRSFGRGGGWVRRQCLEAVLVRDLDLELNRNVPWRGEMQL